MTFQAIWLSLYLAQAYVANGELAQALEVLRTQRQLTPDHQVILSTIEEYEQKLTDRSDGPPCSRLIN